RNQSRRERLSSVLYNAAETVRIIATLLAPIVPQGSSAILKQLGLPGDVSKLRLNALNWGGLQPGTEVGTVEAVYPRLDVNAFHQAEANSEPVVEKEEPTEEKAQREKISIEDFSKVEMKVGRIVSAESIPKSSKLLKLHIDVGDEVRQVVAGIGEAYSPESLKDRKVIVVTNLRPARLMGVESNGMIVAATNGGQPVLPTFIEDVPVG